MKVIGKVLRINKTLTTLDLEENNIGDESVKVIDEGLKTNTTMQYI